MYKRIIDKLLVAFKEIKFDKNLPKYKGKLLKELKIDEWICFGNQFFFIFDLHKQEILFSHKNIEKFLGINVGCISIENLLCIIDLEDCESVLKSIKKILIEGMHNRGNMPLDDVYCMEFRIKKFDNEINWVKAEILTLIKDHSGIPVISLVQITEINDSSEPKEFKMYYCGCNSKNINFPSGRHITYKKGNSLTFREKEILELIRDGKTNKDIAQILCISLGTVNKHRTNILSKTSQHNAADLINWAKNNL